MPATLFLLLATSLAAEVFGVWKVNPARSTLAGNQRTLTLRIDAHARGEVFTLETLSADGRALTSSTILYLDGKARDFQDSACPGTQSSRRVDTQTVEILRECASGRQIRIIRRAVQPGLLTLEITELQRDGRRSESRLVMEKR